MNWIKKLLIFLGSAPLAITLIGAVAVFVIAGTIIESKTESHRLAAMFTYNSPFFSVLIWLLFINILVSALRRWPFQQKHIPFLMTHLGLLMILSGVIVKNHYGIQGAMSILEGGVSQHLLMPDTYAVYVQNKHTRSSYEIRDHSLTEINIQHPHLNLSLVGYYPHSEPKMEGWIKGKQGVIAGLPSFPVSEDFLKICCRARFEDKEWNIYALRTDDIENQAKEAYVTGVTLVISETQSGKIISEIALRDALDKRQVELIFPFSLVDGFVEPALIVDNQVRIPLSGSNALVNENMTPPYIGKAPITVDLKREPSLVILQDDQQDVFYFAFDEHGAIHQEPFRFDALTSLISYDDGYSGYAVPAKIQSRASRHDRDQKEIAAIEKLLTTDPEAVLSPPLELLREAAQKNRLDFPKLTSQFLDQWERSGTWLLSDYPLPPLNWEGISAIHKRGCQWIAKIIPGIESEMKKSKDFFQVLAEKQWPLLSAIHEQRNAEGPCRPEEVLPMLTLLSHQIVSVSDQLPSTDIFDQSSLLSAYMRLYGIHLSLIRNFQEEPNEITIESPLTVRHQKKHALSKLEENIPLLVLEVAEGDLKEKVSLAFDRFASGLKWPILNGRYLIRFQPRWKAIPYQVRVRDARQINYAQSQQPFSYECDLLVTDLRDGTAIEKTISMNNVHQTWDGYRFYLSNISPGEETAPQRVQIIVNYDPAKYWLTYPGAMVVSLGILLLFWMRPYSTSR
jgi:hypothetical protein